MNVKHTTVSIAKKDLEIIKRYCQIWRLTPSKFFHVMAESIEDKLPNLTERKMKELRSLQDSQYHVNVIMKQKE